MVVMPPQVIEVLACPVCAADLMVAGNTLVCPDRHSFDFARQGYVNLLTGRAAASNADTAPMVAARAEFLSAGHYAPLAARLASRVSGAGLVVDAGAGTGYYLGAVLDGAPDAFGLAMDLSAPALRRAAKAHPRLGAAVGDVWRPWPVRSGVADVVLNVFAPRNGAEFRRVLRPDGRLLVVTPGPDHLAELSGLLAVDPDKDRRLAAALDGFSLVDRETCRVPLSLSPLDVWRVAHMGPAGHHRSDAPPGEDGPATSATASFVLSSYCPD